MSRRVPKKNSSGNDEDRFKMKMLADEVDRLKHENIKLKLAMSEAGIADEENKISNEEAICYEQIEMLKLTSSERQLTVDEVKILDTLHKNLKLARGENSRIKKGSKLDKMSAEDLMKEIQEGK